MFWKTSQSSQINSGTQLAGGGGRFTLPSFKNRKKVPWFWKNVPCLCVSMGRNSHLKCNFKSILEKKDQNLSMRCLSFVCQTWNIYLSDPFQETSPAPKKSWLRAWNLRSSHLVEIFQNSQKNIFTGISFLITLQGGNLNLSEGATGDVQ